MAPKLIKNIGNLLTCAGGNLPRRHKAMRELAAIQHAYVIVDSAKGCIAEVGVGQPPPDSEFSSVFDAEGLTVIPGLIDAHTHPVYAGSRAGEFYMRASGKTYLEIAASGGGINASVMPTRNATLQDLIDAGLKNARQFLFHGTTTFEAKSGYGLNFKSELTMLEAIRELKNKTRQEIVTTFLGAHTIPDEYKDTRSKYLELVCGDMLKKIKAKGLAEYVDVFIEEGAFTIEEGERVIQAAVKNGFGIRIHADEFTDKGGAALGAKYNAASVDHLGAISEAGIQALAGSNTVAVLMPGTIFFIGSSGYAPARKLIDNGAAVALASDHNPGSSMIYGLPFVMSLAVLKMNMSVEECITASTINAAFSLGKSDFKGSIDIGKDADLIVLDTEQIEDLPYKIGASIIRDVMIRGEWVKRNHRLLEPKIGGEEL